MSVKQAGWDTIIDFLSALINSGISTKANIAITEFARDSYIIMNFNDTANLTVSEIATKVEALTFKNELGTNTGASILQAEMMFGLQGSTVNNRILVFITDGNPWCNSEMKTNLGCTTDICQYAPSLRADNIDVVIIGVGASWTQAKMDCLVVDDSKDIITVSEFSAAAFDAVLPSILSITCPVTYDLMITEMKPAVSGGDTTGIFVELYNYGTTVELSYIFMSGLFSGVLTTNSSIKLKQGQYLVIYDGKASNPPKCNSCSCTANPSNSEWCANAIYIGCDGGTTYPCEANAKPINFTTFNIQFTDISVVSNTLIIDSISYTTSWPKIAAGYTLELQSIAFDNQDGDNWANSCDIYGTPGTTPVTSCTGTCQSKNRCQLNGDTGANTQCDTTNNKCICTSVGYYAVGYDCYLLPAPELCTAYMRQNGTNQYVEYIWSKAATDAAISYQLNYYAASGTDSVITGSRIKLVPDYDSSRTLDQSAGNVQTYFYDKDTQVAYKSTATNCAFSPTPSPTTAIPTSAPTYTNPKAFFDGGDLCGESRCTCENAGWTCVGDALQQIYTPTVGVPKIFSILKWPGTFGSEVSICYEISLVTDNDNSNSDGNSDNQGRRRMLNDTTTTEAAMTTTTSMPAWLTAEPSNGCVLYTYNNITFEWEYLQRIEVWLNETNASLRGDLDGNKNDLNFVLNITNCTSANAQFCQIVYPSQIYWVVEANDQQSQSGVETELPSWAWWVIAIVILGIIIVLALLYKYCYKSKKTHGQSNTTIT